MKALALLAILIGGALGFLVGCSPHFDCRRDAYATNSHVNAGTGFLGSLAVAAATPTPPPHPPLAEMLAACGSRE